MAYKLESLRMASYKDIFGATLRGSECENDATRIGNQMITSDGKPA